MAKKKKKEKEEESYEFKMPEFDETEFLKKEVRDAKSLLVTFGYALLIGIISFGLAFFNIALSVLVGIIAVPFLRHIYLQIGIDISLIEKKQWAGNIALYVFTWLAIWILLTNPPFSDIAAPTINGDSVYFGSPGNWTEYNETTKTYLVFGMNVSINVTVVDNTKVDASSVMISIQKREGNLFVEIERGQMEKRGKNEYIYILSDIQQGQHRYTITANDMNDYQTTKSGTFNVN
jgi:hypothetical protein